MNGVPKECILINPSDVLDLDLIATNLNDVLSNLMSPGVVLIRRIIEFDRASTPNIALPNFVALIVNPPDSASYNE
jgi:hypothetical protein